MSGTGDRGSRLVARGRALAGLVVVLVLDILPVRIRSRIETLADALRLVSEVRDPRVLRALGPSSFRGLLLQQGKAGHPTRMPAHHATFFDWSYPHESPEMQALYKRAKRTQWDGDSLPWNTSVDPFDPGVKLLPDDFVAFDVLERAGLKMGPVERRALLHEIVSWMMSQFLHGEQALSMPPRRSRRLSRSSTASSSGRRR